MVSNRNETLLDCLKGKHDPRDSGEYTENCVFVGMAFDLPLDLSDTFQVINETCKKLGLEAKRTDQNMDSGNIHTQILTGIEEAEFLIFDVSNDRPNIYYEIGYAHGVGNRPEEIILIAKKGAEVHFDISHFRIIYFENNLELENKLRKRLGSMIDSRKIS